jgi:hypothetical protein
VDLRRRLGADAIEEPLFAIEQPLDREIDDADRPGSQQRQRREEEVRR